MVVIFPSFYQGNHLVDQFLFPFGVGGHHQLQGHFTDFVVAVGTSRGGIDFNALDQKPVRIVALIAGPSREQQRYLEILAGVTLRLHSHTEPGEDRDWLVLELTDDGPGFPARVLAAPFEPYVSDKARGSGLGLAICRKIVAEHDGRVTIVNPPSGGARSYADFADDHANLVIGGAIVASLADLSHPLAWGLQRPELPLFRQGTTLLRPSDNPYATPVRYSDEPLMAGFIGQQRQDEMRGEPAVIAERQGDGLVVRFANTPLFRGFWRGTEKLFVNALFFGQTVQSTTLPRVTGAPIPEPERSRQ